MARACIITTGSEIVEGFILDQNSKWLASKLISIGWKVGRIISVDDDYKAIEDALKCSMNGCDLIIITGGLGPTKDDITRDVVADFFGKKLIFNKKLYSKVEKKVKEFADAIVETIRKEAMVIEGAEVIDNDVGSAPGQLFEFNGRIVVLLPGPPREMENVFSKIEKKISRERRFYTRVLKFYGIKESVLENELKNMIYTYPTIKVAFQADYIKGVTLRLTTEENNKDAVDSLIEKIYSRLGMYIYAEGEKDMEDTIVDLLKGSKKTLSIAESCTGGLLSCKIVNVPGSSKVFKGGIIAYDNFIKRKFLKVKNGTLKKFGAVSSECVIEMLRGVYNLFGTDYSIAVSGIAGPSGGSKNKPVGTVYIGIKSRNLEKVKRFYFKGERNVIRYKSVYEALNILRKVVLGGDSSDER
ncbi:MAG: competence/damage-inducible protein A [Thermotogaceae bacterium]|nr:competence/damage-inducible protein A [Thermotogaceae bacterium]